MINAQHGDWIQAATFGTIIPAFSVRQYPAESPINLVGLRQNIFVFDIVIPGPVRIPKYGQFLMFGRRTKYSDGANDNQGDDSA